MKRKIIYAIFSIFVLLIGVFSLILNKNNDEPLSVVADNELNLNCGAAYLIEENSQKVLYTLNETDKMYPASMTKMMGLILVCEAIESNKIKLDDIVSVSLNASSMGGSQVFLEPFEQISVDELLKCVCIASANDAMYALSELVASSNDAFIKMMNDKAKELKLVNTNFVNVTGFDDDNHYTCAKDMAIIALELLKYKHLILHYTSIYDSHIREDSDQPFWLVNTNKMVKYYQGMDGLKTGYTSKAGFCLTATASRNNVRLVSVIMNAKTSAKRNEMTKTLLDYGFLKLNGKVIYEKDSHVADISIKNAKEESIPIYCKNDIILVHEGAFNEENMKKTIILKDNLSLPIKANEEVGFLLLDYNEEQYQYPLYVKEEVLMVKYSELIKQYLLDMLF
ncbi:MAG: D-alanyl-D-alanine carboxypeptidase [Erysipelotrichaceae bacterium]|nr:D-alanyl-D-alanine carboxypeptidase [Erysipelotrichaceae bacterium]